MQVRDLGVWFRLHRKKRTSLKSALLSGHLAAKHELLWALRHVSLECHEGQVVGVIGPNGAGKSTLCLTLARILTPDEGEVRIEGQVSSLLTLGAGFNRELSGRANIQLYAAFLGIPRRRLDEKMEEIIDFSELGGFIDEPVRSYSTGMRARLGFSVVTTLDPEILVLDEVLSVGDRAFRAKSEERMRQMMRQSKLIIIVSHSSSLLREICTHCLWLEQGRTRRWGAAGEILDAYDEKMGGTDADPAETDA
ncbi:MAG: ABC transporter ATP-binding protein [Planctomycetota bacterium]|nr:ABC transporter ATP-binding protein [Planctomycetota bacterium]